MSTRERLLDVALDMFSRRGYAAVSVRDIAYAVGVKESALYKHFRGKRDLLDELVRCYRAQSDAFMSSIGATSSGDEATLERQVDLYRGMDDDAFLAVGSSVFTQFLMTPAVLRFWRMISIERCNDPDMARLFDEELIRIPLAFQGRLFEGLVGAGAVRDVGADTLARAFYLPALMLYLRALPYGEDDEEREDTLRMWRAHMLDFRRIYGKPTDDTTTKEARHEDRHTLR